MGFATAQPTLQIGRYARGVGANPLLPNTFRSTLLVVQAGLATRMERSVIRDRLTPDQAVYHCAGSPGPASGRTGGSVRAASRRHRPSSASLMPSVRQASRRD